MATAHLDLLILRGAAGYEVQASGPAGLAAGPVASPLDPTQADLQEMVAHCRAGQATPQEVERIGRRLFAALFPHPVDTCLSLSRNEVGDEGMLVLRLRLPPDRALEALPWELLFDDSRNLFLARDYRTPIVRCPGSLNPVESPPLAGRLRVLVAVALPDDEESLPAAQREAAAIERALQGLRDAGELELARLSDVSWRNLQSRTERCHVLHYIGHGGALDRGYLAGNAAGGGTEAVDERQMRDLVRNRPQLRLVVLNACETAAPSPAAGRSLGMARALADAGLPAVIAMQQPVDDQAAGRFATRLYQCLAQGQVVERALTEARLALAGRDDPAWAIPVLVARQAGVAFAAPPAGEAAAPLTPWQVAVRGLAVASLVAAVFLVAVWGQLYVKLATLAALVGGGVLKVLDLLGFKIKAWDRLAGALDRLARGWAGRSALIAVAACLLALSATWGVQGARRIITEPTPTPQPGMAPMTGAFNVAVAGMGTPGAASGEIGNQVSKWLRDDLARELAAAGLGLRPDVDVFLAVHPSSEGEAAALARAIGAHLVIYGDVLESGGVVSITPRFYVHDIPNVDPSVTGLYELSRPVTTTLPFTSDSWGRDPRLNSRARALARFTAGLVELRAGDAPAAIKELETAIAGLEAQALPGSEVFHVFLGSALLTRAETTTGEPAAADRARARALYEALLQAQPDYARAYLGLANSQLAQAVNATPIDVTGLAEAIRLYGRACAVALPQAAAVGDDCPVKYDVLSNLPGKVRVGQGNVYIFWARADPGRAAELLGRAEAQYLPVTRAYEEGRTDLRELAGDAYRGLGIVYEDLRGPGEAAATYAACLTTGVRSIVAGQAAVRLACACEGLANPRHIVAWIRWCRDLGYGCDGRPAPKR